MTRHRIIDGLVWARPCLRPEFVPKPRLRGSKAEGLRYERRVAAAIPQAQTGLWFEYIDAHGKGWCNPDLVIDLGDCLAVLECKRTERLQAQSQILDLYKPVMELALGRAVIGVQVTKFLTQMTDITQVTPRLVEALARARSGEVPTLHWLGKGPI